MESIDPSSFMKTGEKTFELLDKFVECIGEKNVVQVITDNGSNYVLAAHCIDLILEDIEKLPTIKRTLTRAITLNGFIYNHVGVLNMMREFTKQRELWLASKWAKEAKGKQVSEIVLMSSFWNHVVYILKVMGPLVKVLQLVDNERKPAMGGSLIPVAIRSRKMLAPDIDESNEWLIGKISEEDTTIHAEDDLVFEDDSLTWGVVASASGVGDANISTRLRPRSKTSLKGDLVAATSQPDFEEKESNLEDIEEDDNEMEGYQSSLDESNDNFNFNDDYNGDA
ncbi:hypothetical protein CK203_093252 [Vitis vinifera]|uniref:DUF659 domain-containing protein n=1 Tax=Vitis vinifera TaxID=29760 RepID=A0A438CMF9_VITVI|nr:hypothetical protein CK203_093252 [Vitis vinifera]